MARRGQGGSTKKPTNRQAARQEFKAAVRYNDGSRELICIKNADNLDDARAMVFDLVLNVQSAVIALNKPKC